ncbi:MAG TPA: YncE family protein [Bacteroidota bacterium]|nr:YncE family protein [Bacteroidota bacterium]
MKYLYALILLVISGLLSYGCSNNSPSGPSNIVPPSTKGVYVVNEGNFGHNNATLTFYVPDSQKAYQDVFAAVNGRGLGDTGNDILIHSGKAYIVVNNSQKIEVINIANNVSVGTVTIPGSRSPYKLAILNDSSAYVSNVDDSSVTEFNPTSLQITQDRIRVGQNPQGVAIAYGKLYVCNSGFGGDSTVTVVSTVTNAPIKNIVVGKSPSWIAVDSHGNVVVKCDGYSDYIDSTNDTPGGIYTISSIADTVMMSLPLPLEPYGHPGRMAVSAQGVGFVQVRNAILEFDTNTDEIVSAAFLSLSWTPYGIAYDDIGNRLYLSDPVDYVQPGKVHIYNASGSEVTSFSAGVIPGEFAFTH